MNTKEARQMAQGKPSSFLHIIRSEIDLADSVDPHTTQVYELAKKNLETMLADGRLLREEQPRVYVYRLTKDGRTQTGIAALHHIDDYLNDVIKKHELTRRDKEEDRLQHIQTTGTNCEPVFLAFKSKEQPGIKEILKKVKNPIYDVTPEDGVRHEIFILDSVDEGKLLQQYRALPCVYIADGHHRSASTVRVGKAKREKSGAGLHEWFLAVSFPDEDLAILPYNRVVKDLNGMTPDQFLEKIKTSFEVQKGRVPSALHKVAMYFQKEWYTLTAKPSTYEKADAIGKLDVSVLQTYLLSPLLGIDDPRTSERVAFVGGIRGESELVSLVDRGEFAVAFSMYPTSMQELFDIADAGQIMPPKSTWFEPKLRSGFLVHKFE